MEPSQWLEMRWLYNFVAILCMFGVENVSSACPGGSNFTSYIPINETNYDMNYSNIDSGKFPLGFYSSIWYYNQDQPNPCVKVDYSGASTVTNLEIMIETVPSSRLCVRTSDGAVNNNCFQGRGRWCGVVNVPSKSIYVEFFCDSQCETADVNFWYRLVYMPPGYEGENDVWCSNDRDSKYPSDLIKLDPGMTFPSYSTPAQKGTGDASITLASQALTVVCAVSMVLLFPLRSCH